MNLSILLILGIVIGCLLAGKILIHYFQLESYQFPGYFRTIRRNLLKAVLPGFCMTILLTAALTVCTLTSRTFTWAHYAAVTAVMIAGGWLIGRSFSEKNAKKRARKTIKDR